MSRIFSSCVALGWMALTPVVFTGPNPTVSWEPALSTMALGQAGTPSQSPEISKRKVAELLTDARRAMTEGNWETADSLISRAEGMNAKFGLFYIGDTPQKARRDLQLRRRPRPNQNTASEACCRRERPCRARDLHPRFAGELGQEPTHSTANIDQNNRVATTSFRRKVHARRFSRLPITMHRSLEGSGPGLYLEPRAAGSCGAGQSGWRRTLVPEVSGTAGPVQPGRRFARSIARR